jgi:hypothetical protein
MHEILDWFSHSTRVIVLHSVFIYYTIKIDYSLFGISSILIYHLYLYLGNWLI